VSLRLALYITKQVQANLKETWTTGCR